MIRAAMLVARMLPKPALIALLNSEVQLERELDLPWVVRLALAMILMKFLPFVPGHFGRAQLAALGGWMALGWVLKRKGRSNDQRLRFTYSPPRDHS